MIFSHVLYQLSYPATETWLGAANLAPGRNTSRALGAFQGLGSDEDPRLDPGQNLEETLESTQAVPIQDYATGQLYVASQLPAFSSLWRW